MPVGLHTGEVELVGHDIGGIAVHVAARVMSQAVAGEILCSCTVKDLSLGPASPLMTVASVGSKVLRTDGGCTRSHSPSASQARQRTR